MFIPLSNDGFSDYEYILLHIRPMLRRVKKTGQKNIVLDTSADTLPMVLLQAQQVGLNGPDYSYIITCLVNCNIFMSDL